MAAAKLPKKERTQMDAKEKLERIADDLEVDGLTTLPAEIRNIAATVARLTEENTRLASVAEQHIRANAEVAKLNVDQHDEIARLREALEQTRGALMSEGVGSPEWHDAIMAADAALVKGEA